MKKKIKLLEEIFIELGVAQKQYKAHLEQSEIQRVEQDESWGSDKYKRKLIDSSALCTLAVNAIDIALNDRNLILSSQIDAALDQLKVRKHLSQYIHRSILSMGIAKAARFDARFKRAAMREAISQSLSLHAEAFRLSESSPVYLSYTNNDLHTNLGTQIVYFRDYPSLYNTFGPCLVSVQPAISAVFDVSKLEV